MNKVVPVAILALVAVYFYLCDDDFDAGSIKGKRVVVTGASSGIGEHLAYEYCKLGAKVFIAARRGNLLEKVTKQCKKLGALQVEFVASDLGEQSDRDKVITEVKKRFGGLDHLILNHAVTSPGLWLGTEENLTKFMHDMNVNFLSFVDLASQTLPMLIESRGNIGVVSSVAGKIAIAGQASYSTCKHAMQGFFSALRQELLLTNTGVSVTTCVIGAVDTDMMTTTKEQHQKLNKDAFFSVLDAVVTAKDTAVAIIRGVTKRKYEIYYGRIAWVIVSLHKMFPGYFEDILGKQILTMFNLID